MIVIKILLVDPDSDWLNILKSEILTVLINLGFSKKDIIFIFADSFQEAYELIINEYFELVIINIIIGKPLVIKAHEFKLSTIVFIPKDFAFREIRDLFLKYKVCDVLVNTKEDFNIDDFIDKIQEIFRSKQVISQVISHSSNELSKEDRQYLIKKLAELGKGAMIHSKQYFEKVVNSLDLPSDWSNNLAGAWTGDLNYDAEKLITWCEIRYYPNGSNKSGKKVLGYLIKELFEQSGDRKLREIIMQYELIPEDLL